MHALLHLIASRPQLLADHAQAYGTLLTTEFANWSNVWRRRALLLAIALFCCLVACILTGVALLLWALMPLAAAQAPVSLIMVPLVPLALGVGCLFAARSKPDRAILERVREQLKADLAMWREASSP